MHVLSPRLLEQTFDYPKVDLDRQILKPLAGTGRMYCYDSPEYVKDMGTPERLAQVCEDFRRGKVQARNLRHPQRAVFLDRDGTINKYVAFLRNIDDFELLPGAAEAIREIHNKMETLLGREGAYIDALYSCPHHPDKKRVCGRDTRAQNRLCLPETQARDAAAGGGLQH